MTDRLTGKEDANREFPGYFKLLSERLYQVLENNGVTTAKRDAKIKLITTDEILYSAIVCANEERKANRACYVCGSSYEGSATLGLHSDLDYLHVSGQFYIVTSITEAQQYQICFLLIQDSYTPPGYAKLQFVVQGIALHSSLCTHLLHDTDLEGRAVFTLNGVATLSNSVWHGPALTVESEFGITYDKVYALRCHTWPVCASEWLTRGRHYNWPTQEQLDECKTLGFFVVYVGHPTSVEKRLQWRLSFTLQERMLVTDFNSVQLKCYVLLKMIKKEIIEIFIGEESVSSYHFKTCMLYMIETTPAEFWTVDNLLVCLYKCIAKMLTYVEKGECPNYFIPEENMFEGRINGQTQAKLCDILRLLLSADFKYLLGINCDELGIKYEKAILSGVTDSAFYAGQLLMQNYVARLTTWRNVILRTSQTNLAKALYSMKLLLQRTDHSVEQTREALSLLVPYVDLSLMSVSVVKAKSLSNSNEFIFNLLSSFKWHDVSLQSDSFSAELKQAYLMTVLGYCEMSLDILSPLQDQVGDKISGCSCIGQALYCDKDFTRAMAVASPSSSEELLRRYWVPCVVFLPKERELAPPVICYEMDRSIGSPAEEKQNWYDWAVVDGKILLYFLLYLNHRQLVMEAHAAADADNILWLICTDRLLRHRETALNLLGWINKERGLVNRAVICFEQSLTLKPTHNAASLHLRDIHGMQYQ